MGFTEAKFDASPWGNWMDPGSACLMMSVGTAQGSKILLKLLVIVQAVPSHPLCRGDEQRNYSLAAHQPEVTPDREAVYLRVEPVARGSFAESRFSVYYTPQFASSVQYYLRSE